MRRPTFTGRKLLEITAAYEAFVGVGFPVSLTDPNSGDPVAETLQVARNEDQTNWLIVKGICEEGIAAGVGDVPDLIFLQTTSNRRYDMTFSEALTIIRALRDWGLAAWANWNRLKDLARAAQDNDELRAIDITEGYP